MISPILTYANEAWGLYIKQDFKTWDSSPTENVQLQFCKRYLETNNKASNLACRAELGRFPLIININKHISQKQRRRIFIETNIRHVCRPALSWKRSFYSNLMTFII